MTASGSKRSVAEEIYDILMLDIEDEIEIIVQKEDENDVEESKKRIKKNDSYNQPSVPVDDVPVSCFSSVTVVNPVSVDVPVLFRNIKDWGKLLKDLPCVHYERN